MQLTVCIPARNEATHVADSIRRLARSLELVKGNHVRGSQGTSDGPTGSLSDSPNEVRKSEGEGGDGPNVRASECPMEWKIVVAVNGSTDGTAERAREVRWSDGPNVRIEVLDCPKAGKGAAIKFAAEKLPVDTGQWIVGEAQSYSLQATRYKPSTIFGFIDADLSADPDAIPDMVEKIINDEADIVIASRWLHLKTTNRAFFRNATSWVFNAFAHALLGLKVKDAQCGLKIMNSKAVEILKKCREDGWFLDIEFLSLASRQGLRIIEVPVPWTEFRYPDRKSQIRHLRDGWGALVAMCRIRRLRE